MKKAIRGAAVLGGLLLVMALLLTAVDVGAFAPAFYQKQFETLDVMKQTGMEEEDLMTALTALLDYIRGQRDDIVVTAPVDGEVREVFDERETAHMVDVRALYEGAMAVRTACLALGAALIVFAAYRMRDLGALCKRVLLGFTAGLGLIAAVAAVAAVDFNWFWTQFHHVFFTNDLWLLDPFTSIMINMLPEPLFGALVGRIVLWFFGLFAAGVLVCALGVGLAKRKERLHANDSGH